MKSKILIFIFFLSAAIALLPACKGAANQATQGSREMTPTDLPVKTAEPTPSLFVPSPSPTSSATVLPNPTLDPGQGSCRLGIGLREETTAILLDHLEQNGMVMTASSLMAEKYFPTLNGWLRVIGAPSLDMAQTKAERAASSQVPYEALAYGLETGETTPEVEWQNLGESTANFRQIADQYEKISLVGPGFRLMSSNENQYPAMAKNAGILMIQTQQLQKGPPGPDYRAEVGRIIDLLRSGNPELLVWAQITFPPNRDPDAVEWLAYHQAIADLVDGVYIGVYTWDQVNTETLQAAISYVFDHACQPGW
jgi:hypothetical protein